MSNIDSFTNSVTVLWVFLAYFDPTKTQKVAKIYSFLTYMSINILVWTLQCAETLDLYLFCPWKKIPSKLGYFSRIEEIFLTAASPKPDQNQNLKLCFIEIPHRWTYIQLMLQVAQELCQQPYLEAKNEICQSRCAAASAAAAQPCAILSQWYQAKVLENKGLQKCTL